MMMIWDRNTRNHLSQLNDKMVNIKVSILDANFILDRIMEANSLREQNFAKLFPMDNANKSDAQNFVEKKDNVSTGIRTGLPPWAYNIIVRDYDKINSILGENDTIESLNNSFPDFNNRNVSFCESEALSSFSFVLLSHKNSKYDCDSDGVTLTKDDKGLIYFDAADFELDNNKEQVLPDNFEEDSNIESADMFQSNKLWINNVEKKGEKRLFDTFNEYLGTDKLYSENLHVEYENEILRTIGHYEDNNNSGPATLTEVSYKVICNNDIGEYLLVFEEKGSMKSKIIVRINNNLEFGIHFNNSIICKYTTENQLFNRLIRWTVMFKDSLDVSEFCTLVHSFR